MTVISKIIIRNFLSIGNIEQEIDLTTSGLTLILGENCDITTVGDNRNGVGKTTILQAISYGLYGEPLAKIRLDNLVNNINNKGMLVKVYLTDGEKKYTIERGRKPNVLRFFVDGVESKTNEAEGANRHTQEEIDRIIGMTHNMFKHIVALNTSTEPFMRLKAADQREIIEELLGITQLSQRAAALKELMDVTKELLRTEEATIKATNEANTRIEQAITRALVEEEAWQSNHERQTSILIGKADKLALIDIDAEISLFDRIDTWLEQKKEIDDLSSFSRQEVGNIRTEIARLKKEISRYVDEASRVDNGELARLEAQQKRYLAEAEEDVTPQINRLNSEIERKRKNAETSMNAALALAPELDIIQAQIDTPDSHTCPSCGQGIAGTQHLETIIAKLKKQFSDIEAKIEKCIVDHDTYNREADDIEAEIAKVIDAHALKKDQANNNARAIKNDIVVARTLLEQQKEAASLRVEELKEMLVTQETKLQENMSVLEEAQSVMDAIGEKPISIYPNREAVWQIKQDREVLLSQIESELAKENPHSAKIEGLRSTLVIVDYDPINEYTTRQKHEIFLYKLLTAKDSFIRKKIVDQNLLFLNNRINFYLDKIGLPHETLLMPDLSIQINLLGREMDFEQLSKGERNRIVLSTFWSFRDVWESLNTSFNLLFVDEILDDGMDGAGSESALALLQSIARDRKKNVFLISHKENLVSRADKIMLVRKENQFTTIEADYELV